MKRRTWACILKSGCYKESSQRWHVENHFMSQNDEAMNIFPGRFHYKILTLGIILIISSHYGFMIWFFLGLFLVHEYKLKDKEWEDQGKNWVTYICTQLNPLAELLFSIATKSFALPHFFFSFFEKASLIFIDHMVVTTIKFCIGDSMQNH